MLKSVLIANRGEIAVRIAKTCSRLGIRTVGIYNDLDVCSPHRTAVDTAVIMPGTENSETYLNGQLIIEIAQKSGAQAIHPGYGFLAEQAAFAEAVESAGLIFIGPSPETLRLVGAKDSARQLANSLGIPLPKGSSGKEKGIEALTKAAEQISFPLLIKAAAGGGGRGMRLVDSLASLPDALSSAEREAKAAFGDPTLILEQYIKSARHIEVQLLGDSFGNIIHLYERDCSLQRRYQKVIEESPARGLESSVKEALLSAALKFGKAANLRSAATVEFLVPTVPTGEQFYFLEVNPRIQVEHPVTEMVLGLDIVELQLLVAAGNPLKLCQSEIKQRGYAVEARICTEATFDNFKPRTGRIEQLHLPTLDSLAPATATDNSHNCLEIRYDHALVPGLEISGSFDSMILKIICHAQTADQAHRLLSEACKRAIISGVETNLPFLLALVQAECFVNPLALSSHALEDSLTAIVETAKATLNTDAALACFLVAEVLYWRSQSIEFTATDLRQIVPLHGVSSFAARKINIFCPFFKQADLETVENVEIRRSHLANSFAICFLLNREPRAATVGVRMQAHESKFTVSLQDSNKLHLSLLRGTTDEFQQYAADFFSLGQNLSIAPYKYHALTDTFAAGNSGSITSPLPGRVLRCLVSVGQQVSKGDGLIVLESMKMEHLLVAPHDGVVTNLFTTVDCKVSHGEQLVVVTPLEINLKEPAES